MLLWQSQIPPRLRVDDLATPIDAVARAGAMDAKGREALCRYVLRPLVAQERVTRGPDGLVRVVLKKPFADGTVAVDMDPRSRLSRLAAAVPPPRLPTIRYAGVLAPASKLRARIVPKPAVAPDGAVSAAKPKPSGSLRVNTCVLTLRRPTWTSPGSVHFGSRYRPWAELLPRGFSIDVLACLACGGRLRLIAMVTEPKSIRRFLRGLGVPTEAPLREPARGPPYGKSRVLRRQAGEVSVA